IDALQNAVQQTERAGQIIQRMRDFAKYGKLHFEKFDMNELIFESILLIQREFPETKVKIVFDSKSSQPFVIADKIQLEQVILNLLRNGIEVLMDGRTLNPEIQIKCENFSTQHIFVSVSDNGPGLSFDVDSNKIFEACFTTKSTGLGMGLAISRTVIEAH